jgi:Ni/Co efflux regulator RcnB
MMMKSILSAVALATLALGTAAHAGDATYDHTERREARKQQRLYQQQPQSAPVYQQRQSTRQYDQQAYRNYDRRYDRATYTAPRYEQRSYAYNTAPAYTYSAPQYRSYGYAPRYYSGGYVPSHFRAQRYWVNDWRARHLSAPPYGYQWVETDTGDVLLMALATGLIASVIMSAY